MEKNTIVVASHNTGKITELTKLLEPFNFTVAGLSHWPQLKDILETGSTFAENALIKAQTVAKVTGHIAIADDSGLIVQALNGKPGVFSARYSDDWESLPNETMDMRNIRKLLYQLREIPAGERQAYFKAAMAAVSPSGQSLTAEGIWAGEILFRPRGHNGFGYDPVFFDPRLEKSGAELTREEKNAISHRGKALTALLAKWPEFMERLHQ